jgi:serine/threonine protein kinase
MCDGHPHIIGFIGAFVTADGLDIVQEFAEGGTLQQRIDRRRELQDPLLESEVLDTFIQLTGALEHLHSHKVLHRDLKPANVFFDRRNLARLGDFGIAAIAK